MDTQTTVSGILAAGLMDGTVAIVEWAHTFGSSHALSLSVSALLRMHTKYASRVAFSADGSLLASASHDGSVCLFTVEPTAGVPCDGGLSSSSSRVPPTPVVVRLLQRVFWGPPGALAGGPVAVEAITWAPLPVVEGSSGRCEGAWGASATLVVSIRGAPTLQYLSVLSAGLRSQDEDQAAELPAALRRHGLDAAAATTLPLLPPGSSRFLVLHRIPLSEDGGLASIFRGAPGALASGGALSVVAVTDDDAEPSSSGAPGIHVLPTQSTSQADSVVRHSRFADFSSASSGAPSGSARGGAGEALEDRSEGGFFIPVGFTVIDLAVAPGPDSRAPPLLAAAADNGVIFVFRLGSNAVLRRLVGHSVSSELSAGTRIAWWPGRPRQGGAESDDTEKGEGWEAAASSSSHYLVASSERDFALVVYSVGAQREVGRLGRGQPLRVGGHPALWTSGSSAVQSDAEEDSGPRHTLGHAASIKAVVCAQLPSESGAASVPVLITAGFDKRVIVWA